MHLHTLVLSVVTYLPLCICFSPFPFFFFSCFACSPPIGYDCCCAAKSISPTSSTTATFGLLPPQLSWARFGLELLDLVRFRFGSARLELTWLFRPFLVFVKGKVSHFNCLRRATMPTTRPLTISIPSLASRVKLCCQVFTTEKINFSRSIQGHIINKISARTRMVSVWLHVIIPNMCIFPFFFNFFKSISVDCVVVECFYLITMSINTPTYALNPILNAMRFIVGP